MRDWPDATTQAGDALRGLLAQMGCTVSASPSGLRGHRPTDGWRGLRGLQADLHDVGELAPAIAALCALAQTPSHLTGIAHIRGHETDRLAALATELGALGADVDEHPDGLTIRPAPLSGGLFRTYADHRMAHAGVIIGAAACRACSSRTSPPRARPSPTSRGFWSGLLLDPALMGRATHEQDVEHYERPRRRTSRRTKDRPAHDDAVDGAGRHRRPRAVHPADRRPHASMAMKARPLGRKGVVVGDRVRVVGDVSGADGSLARIVEVQPRASTLRRTADDDDPVERVIVANATQLVVVTALADPEPRPRPGSTAPSWRRTTAGWPPLLVPDQGRPRATPRPCWRRTAPSACRGRSPSAAGPHHHRPRRAPRPCCAERPACWSGTAASASRPWSTRWCPTRAGRPATSTRSPARAGTRRRRRLHCCPLARRRRLDHRHPRHPVVRARARRSPSTLIEAFPDLDEMTEDCPRGCTHGEDEPECGLDDAVADGEADAERVDVRSGGCSPRGRCADH